MSQEKKDVKEVLIKVAELAESEASHHDDHGGCIVGDAAQFVGKVARHAVSQLESPTSSLGGPAQVATAAYRTNYDAIFGKQPVGLA